MKAGKSVANTKPNAAAKKGEFYNPPSLAQMDQVAIDRANKMQIDS